MNQTTNINFASIDQQSECSTKESSCTALVVVLAGWLHNNPNYMPIKSQLDTLIWERYLELRKLWEIWKGYYERGYAKFKFVEERLLKI